MANVTEAIKFAGPDVDNNFKVIQTKNSTLAFPGEVYSMRAYHQLIALVGRRPSHKKLDVTVVENKAGDLARFGLDSVSFRVESGGKVRDEFHKG